jgi:Mg2+-importing ATPase
MNSAYPNFWSKATDESFKLLNSTPEGLSQQEALKRLKQGSKNVIGSNQNTHTFLLLLKQFKSPIIIILFIAAILSFFLQDSTDAVIILAIVFASSLLSFWQEKCAANAMEKLLDIIRIKVHMLRAGTKMDVPVEEIVPGDIALLSAGDMIPGDCLLIESKDLFVNEASLTGESFPAEKSTATTAADIAISKRTNALFMGTHVVSGTAKALVVNTGKDTEFGQISERLGLRPPETDFEKGIRQFGNLLMVVTLVLVVAIFAINVFFHRPVLEAFLFSLAIAVGLTPQLLPAIISVNLSYGAKRMAEQKVIVKVLASIENFGSMNVLCSDKTGTLTEGTVVLHSTPCTDNSNSDKVFLYALLNASLESGFANPIDVAIRNEKKDVDISAYSKIDEVPYDFIRKRLSILVTHNSENLLITKGAFSNIMDVCDKAETKAGNIIPLEEMKDNLQASFQELSAQGFRVLGVAYKNMAATTTIRKEDEQSMVFLGFIVFNDPPKPGILETLNKLTVLGIGMKIITGDNEAIAISLSKQVGLENPVIITGPELNKMSNDALVQRVNGINIFAEVEPNQKERIIVALKKAGNVVGYMGDGINDASALHAADVGISVESAVDAAKGAAHIVLLEKNLDALIAGVREGRKTFANTFKYVFMATSANFGNMFSMAGASLFLPFLPLLPKQILLMNIMTDMPEMTIATDSVDEELILKPRRWNIKFIRNFMLVFGILNSVSDYLTFGVLIFVLHANEAQFQTGWFIENIVSAALIVLVIRTRKPFFRSRPGKYLLAATITIVVVTLILPFTPLRGLFGFATLPVVFYCSLLAIVVIYIAIVEIAKHFFYRAAFKK